MPPKRPFSAKVPTASDERGTLRSGGRFARRNLGYFSSIADLESVHKKLFSDQIVTTFRELPIANIPSTHLLTHVIRCPVSSSPAAIQQELFNFFSAQFGENQSGKFNILVFISENDFVTSFFLENISFEVVTTANVILHNRVRTQHVLFTYIHTYINYTKIIFV